MHKTFGQRCRRHVAAGRGGVLHLRQQRIKAQAHRFGVQGLVTIRSEHRREVLRLDFSQQHIGVGQGQGAASSSTFMGLRGAGSNFVYVLDRSASMEEFGGAPMRFARSELLKSIASLAEKNQFQIVFYNESPGSLSNGGSGGRLLAANDINKEKASRFVKAIKPSGGTEHIPGLKMGLSYAPDVLFFLTDAAEPSLSESQLVEIQNRADRSSTTIHTIQFNRGPAPNDGTWIRELAERNRGTYRYIDISGLE